MSASLDMEIVSQVFGWFQCSLWSVGFVLAVYEPIKIKNSSGLSKNYLVLNIVGFVLFMFQDYYGYFDPECRYGEEVHLTDVILSTFGVFTMSVGLIACYIFPSESNRFNWLGTYFPGSILVLTIVFACID